MTDNHAHTAQLIRENLDAVRTRIARASEKSGRLEADVTLVAVSKTWPADVVQVAVDVGVTTLGENRVQEGQIKVPVIRGDVTWHLVGHLQRNKARTAVALFDTIQSVDSVRLARELSKNATSADRTVRVLVQVNTSAEATKSGLSPDEAIDVAVEIADMDGLRVDGLMTIATLTENPSEVRRCFTKLRDLKDQLCAHIEAPHLSMGMTADYEAAIEEGATIVRIGTGIFGRRTA